MIAVAVAVVLLSGHVLDRTTGQGLAHVRVVAGGAHAVTDGAGAYALRGLTPGAIAVTLESDDVPVQHFTVTVGKRATRHDFRACSTTLDYACGAPAAPSAPGSGAG